jgi:hypothetical protein
MYMADCLCTHKLKEENLNLILSLASIPWYL